MLLRPMPITRIANSSPGLVLALFAMVALLGGTGVQRLLGAAVLPGLWLAVRGGQASAETKSGTLVVRGYLRTRVIPRSAIVELGDDAIVVWIDGAGRRHRTPISVFKPGSRMLTPFARHHARRLRQVQR